MRGLYRIHFNLWSLTSSELSKVDVDVDISSKSIYTDKIYYN